MTRFTEIVPHIGFDWLDAPYEEATDTKASWLDYVIYYCFNCLDFKVGYGI